MEDQNIALCAVYTLVPMTALTPIYNLAIFDGFKKQIGVP